MSLFCQEDDAIIFTGSLGFLIDIKKKFIFYDYEKTKKISYTKNDHIKEEE